MDDYQRNSYLIRKYGITLEEFNRDSINGCQGCGAVGKKRSLHTDHSHAVAKAKIKAYWDGGGWLAMCEEYPWIGTNWNQKKHEATRPLREKLKRLSYRGVLCWGCNSALKKLRDRADIAQKLANYLSAFDTKISQKELQ